MATIVHISRNQKRKTDDSDEDEEKPIIAKTPTDLQRLRLEKLMKHPEKPVPIPERPKEKSMPHVPDFVRNVMGSSAGAGSGEFHVYRHLRRKEYARQKFIQEKAEKETRDDDYHWKLEENKRIAEERTAKKRAKRLKKKQKQKLMKKLKPISKTVKKSDSGTEEDDTEDEETEYQKSKIEDTSCEKSSLKVENEFSERGGCKSSEDSSDCDEGKSSNKQTLGKANSENTINKGEMYQSR